MNYALRNGNGTLICEGAPNECIAFGKVRILGTENNAVLTLWTPDGRLCGIISDAGNGVQYNTLA